MKYALCAYGKVIFNWCFLIGAHLFPYIMKTCLLASAFPKLVHSLFYFWVSFEVILFQDDNLGVMKGEAKDVHSWLT